MVSLAAAVTAACWARDSRFHAAGEATTQARRFLWSNYRNVGGLLYSYVNQYKLYLADDSELRGRSTQ